MDVEKIATDIMKASGFGSSEIEKLVEIGYFLAPASSHHHFAYRGGLLDHSMNVTKMLMKLSGLFGVQWERADGPVYVGMLHDLVKCKCYRERAFAEDAAIPSGRGGYEYVDPGYPGHALASLMIAKDLGIELKSDEKAAIRWHMGLFDMSGPTDRRDFNFALDRFGPHVLATHFADWYSASVIEK